MYYIYVSYQVVCVARRPGKVWFPFLVTQMDGLDDRALEMKSFRGKNMTFRYKEEDNFNGDLLQWIKWTWGTARQIIWVQYSSFWSEHPQLKIRGIEFCHLDSRHS